MSCPVVTFIEGQTRSTHRLSNVTSFSVGVIHEFREIVEVHTLSKKGGLKSRNQTRRKPHLFDLRILSNRWSIVGHSIMLP